ncbi:hypothetical protein ACPYO6_07660 [Georgenia sp. Z1344]|uniref:hypothetical protein n=1 Tax=Georgenia sp. Z1344 TaxID=3416706 RepID=UPI003CE67705
MTDPYAHGPSAGPNGYSPVPGGAVPGPGSQVHGPNGYAAGASGNAYLAGPDSNAYGRPDHGNPYAVPPPGLPDRVRRPGWITAAAIIVWFFAPWALLAGLFAMFIGGISQMWGESDSTVFGDLQPGAALTLIGLGIVVVSVLAIVLGVQLWQGKQVGRIGLTVIMAGALVWLVVHTWGGEGSPWLGVVLGVFVVVAMWLPASTRYVRERAARRR